MYIFRASYWPRMLRANLKLSPMGFKLSPVQVGVVTLTKNKIKFSSYIGKIRGIGCEVMWLKASSYIWKNWSISPYIIGSPSSYMTWHPIPSEFLYIRGKFRFLYYQCIHWEINWRWRTRRMVVLNYIDKKRCQWVSDYYPCPPPPSLSWIIFRFSK